jgi:LysM repeat protein
MRRTTICRSSRAVLLALVAGLLGVPGLGAQDTTRAAADTSQAPAAPAGQLPESHVVTQGETLWSISQLYFSDALLWPEIYRLNTAVVEDPHWIYPGEVLHLAAPTSVARVSAETTAVAVGQPSAADTVRAQGADTAVRVDTTVVDTAQLVEAPPPPPGPTETYETIFDRGRSRTAQVQDILRAYANQPYRPLRRGEFYAAGFLSERERLPWGLVLGATAVPAIPRLTQHTTATVFGQIAIQPPQGASYHVGDSLLIARIDRDVPSWGEVVVPVGVARVTDAQKRQLLGDVIMQFGRIHDGNLAMPLEPFKDAGEVRPVPVQKGLEASVIAQRDLHVLTNAQQILFLNKGRSEGVVPGDLFEIYRPASGQLGGASEQPLIVVEIVHTREHSCSGLVLGITHPGVFPGSPARLIRKMPS